MAKNKEKSDTMATSLMLMSLFVVFLSIYWEIAPLLAQYGISNKYVNMAILLFRQYLEQSYMMKLFALLLLVCSCVFKTGKATETSWTNIGISTAAGFVLFFLPVYGITYALCTFAGMVLLVYGLSLIARKIKDDVVPDEEEGFDQTRAKKENDNSINIPYKFTFRGKIHNGWINFINIFRATLVLGSPGSGKSFAIYNAFIEQGLRKRFTVFLYDYKFPDLTKRLLNELAYQKKYENFYLKPNGEKVKDKEPRLYIINFDDPMKSNRCNPIHHTYITDPADTTEIADLVFKNINKGSSEKGFDFFNESAKVFLDALIWFLANYDPDAIYEVLPDGTEGKKVVGSKSNYTKKGIYCTFPHVIELMACDYKKTFQILEHTEGLEAKISPFASALASGAMEQLVGQIASAQIPLGKFVSPELYWVMSGDDFTLDINNVDEPKYVCMGNNPDRQTIYGTTLALYTSRMFKLINHKGKRKSMILLDELPTIFIKGLDNLIATARSNKVGIVMGAQDFSQLKRDYGDKEADVIKSTTGNLASGSVEGPTAKSISEAFGKKYRKRVSQSIGEDSYSQSVSYQLEDILPASQIMDMSQGFFCGWVKDNYGEFIKEKKFMGEIVVDTERNEKVEAEKIDVPIIKNILGENAPEMTPEDEYRLGNIWPALKGNKEELQKKFIKELVNVEVQNNYTMIKQQVQDMIKHEFERTSKFVVKK